MNPYDAVAGRRRAAVKRRYGYGPGADAAGGAQIAPGSMTPDTSGQDKAMDAVTQAQQQGQFAEGMGQGIGGLAGAGLGALGFLIPGVGAAAGPALMAAGGAAGSAIGKNIGGAWGDDQERNAQNEMDKQRRKAMQQEALMQAIQGLRGF